ncbi:unnamed protein product [Vicia faba]|uniref:Peptidase M41 domain-containing protein n=1 Tax=Vicia faba TaxID=3906 RepID=A0AAV1ATQ6_VICFA|nr:unnamed protein product [Vicia faba]
MRRNPFIIEGGMDEQILVPIEFEDRGRVWTVAETEAVTKSMGRRLIPTASSVDEATQIICGNCLNAIEQHHLQRLKTSAIDKILDIGCSFGVSSRYLANNLMHAIEITVSLILSIGLWPERKEQSLVAYHEVGHAICGTLTPGHDAVQKPLPLNEQGEDETSLRSGSHVQCLTLNGQLLERRIAEIEILHFQCYLDSHCQWSGCQSIRFSVY